MPRWFVTCPQCRHKFTYVDVQPAVIEKSRLDPFGIVPKPAIPGDGDKRTCPQCKTESVFQPFHLFYDSER
jgi:hypothetical protein